MGDEHALRDLDQQAGAGRRIFREIFLDRRAGTRPLVEIETRLARRSPQVVFSRTWRGRLAASANARFAGSVTGHPAGMQTMEIIRDPRPWVPELPDPGPEPAPPPVPTPIPEPPPEPEPDPDPDRI